MGYVGSGTDQPLLLRLRILPRPYTFTVDWRYEPAPRPQDIPGRCIQLGNTGGLPDGVALFIPMTYVSSYALRRGFGLSFSYQIPTILNAASICGRILAGWWGDQFGAFNSHILASILCCTSCLAIWLPAGSSLAGLVVFVTMFGFGSGSHMSMNPVCIGKLCGIKNYGRYWATSCTVASFAGLIGVPLGGQLISGAGGEYWSAIVFAGCLYGACGVTMYAAKGKCVGWKPWVLF
uniref:Major facilitator superfamily (MFS) profile domain-containing protein n=1 Tax=Bionectria ochroleuca TaxID=29856 RepID=A0A8H7N645_BIOOC